MAAKLAPSSLHATLCSRLDASSTASSPIGMRSRPGMFQRQPLRRSAIPSTVSGARSVGLSSIQWLSSSLRQSEGISGRQLHGDKVRALATAAGEASADSPSMGETQTPATAAVKRRVLSGVQPTGSVHLGNYLGAIANWVKLQDLYETYFTIVDLHAITMPHEPKELLAATRRTAAVYLASGIDPAKSSIFVQSHVPAHAELAWLLQCYTPIGWLRKMIQFKEKSRKQGEEVGTGLLTYPALMAADILLYQTDLVPVGADQTQHVELTRDLAERINGKFGGKHWKKLGGRGGRIFKVPELFIPPAGARVMSLTDGTNKMSKSAELDSSRINLLDSPAAIVKKVKGAKTDAFEGLEWDNPERPEARNLLTIYQLATGMSMESVMAECGSLRWGDFKPRLAEALVEHLTPIQINYGRITEDPTYLDSVLAEGADKANESATRTLDNCRQAMGFTPRQTRA